MEDIATFQTLKTWIGHNVTRYNNLNALPHALLHVLLYILFETCLVLGYFRRVNVNFFKKILSYAFL